MRKRQFPSFSQWKQLFKVITGKERLVFLCLSALSVLSFLFLAVSVYLDNTIIAPAYGGSITEGIVGQPRFINPIYGETNDVDRALIDLTYAGLMTYDQNGQIIPDLVKSYDISDNGLVYTFQLKDNLFWQDGKPLTADDVIYTIKTIQNSDYKSPLRANWLNVAVTKISDTSFAFSLGTPYNAFLEICTVKLIPQHIWSQVLPENFTLSSYNLQPVGSGPYIVKKLSQNRAGFITSINLQANSRYHGKPAYIPKVAFKFYENRDTLLKAINSHSVDAFSLSSLNDDALLAQKEVKQGWSQDTKFSPYYFTMPRYFAVFFNEQKPRLFSDSGISKALVYATDKAALMDQLKELTNEHLRQVDSPILPSYYGYENPTVTYSIDTEQATSLLGKSGFKKDEQGMLYRDNTKQLAFQFKSYLKKGSKGGDVTELQTCLARLDGTYKDLMQGDTSGTYGQGTENAITAFQQKYLPEATPTGETGPGTRTKLNELCFDRQDATQRLQFTLKTINQPQLLQVANLLKAQWEQLGMMVTVEPVELSELKDVIKQRDYDALLYGQALGALPDLYPFWHSSQINDPGLNLTGYQNKSADPLLKDAREALDDFAKQQKYEQLQDIILGDTPALFLYNPDYGYWVSGKIQGIDTTKIVDPAKRFENITNWFIKTKRIWK